MTNTLVRATATPLVAVGGSRWQFSMPNRVAVEVAVGGSNPHNPRSERYGQVAVAVAVDGSGYCQAGWAPTPLRGVPPSATVAARLWHAAAPTDRRTPTTATPTGTLTP